MVALIYLLVTLVFSRVVFYIEQGMRAGQDLLGLGDAPAVRVMVDFVILDSWGCRS